MRRGGSSRSGDYRFWYRYCLLWCAGPASDWPKLTSNCLVKAGKFSNQSKMAFLSDSLGGGPL
uniref:Uncharacterized protein n=1 Tax=Picea sitchensis TaxID=3332 RepID=A0A6B9XU98_PICSI|nr:hypothetical protein Q903MT_gene3847 [Picea sitchensis]